MYRTCLLVVVLIAGCTSKPDDQDERLDYCKRMTLALNRGDDGHGRNFDDLKRVVWDKWKKSPRQLAESLDDRRKQELREYRYSVEHP